MTTELQAEQVIDLTERGESMRYVEIITRGGVIRVNTNLVGVQDGREHVVIEIHPSTRAMPRSGDGGHWDVVTHDHGSRTDVSLIRQEA